jgi:hypothetical protein
MLYSLTHNLLLFLSQEQNLDLQIRRLKISLKTHVLEITKKKIQNYQQKRFPLIVRTQSHPACLTPYAAFLHRKLSRIALLEIDHSRDQAYLFIPQPRCHDLFYSHTKTVCSHSRHKGTELSSSLMVSLFLSLSVLDTLFYYVLYLIKIHNI